MSVEEQALGFGFSAEDARRMAADADRLSRLNGDESGAASDTVEIWPENREAVRLFFGLSTQWRTVSLSAGMRAIVMRTALDYAALPAVAAALGLSVDDRMLGQLQTLEAKAAIALADQARRALA